MNKILHGDNLNVMQTLPDKTVDLAYADILFGTGKKFKDKSGNLQFEDLKPNKQIIEGFYIPRFEQIYRLLKPTGQIYIHCDYRVVHWIRCILDDIFGYNNFHNEIIWYYNSAPRRKGSFSNRHDIILRYSKSDNFIFNEDSVREPYSLSAPRGYEKEKYYHPKGKVMSDVWQINMLGQNDKTERVGYQTQKPLELMNIIIKSSSNIGDLCFDPFCGSGSFCLAAKSLGRNYLGIDNSKIAIEKCKERGL
jgi:DNA modification methylase